MGKTGHRDTGIFQALFDFTDQVPSIRRRIGDDQGLGPIGLQQFPGQVALAGAKDDGYRHGEGETERLRYIGDRRIRFDILKGCGHSLTESQVARFFDGFIIQGHVDMGSELAAVFSLAIEAEEDAQDRPAENHAPFLRNQGSPGTGDDVHDDHEARHEDSQGTDEFIMADFIRTSHVRCFFTKDDEGNSDHAVGDAAAEVAGIDDPDQHLFAEERRDDGQEADEQKRIDRRLIFIVQFGKDPRDHIRFSHRVHGTAAADKERIPAGDDAAEAADDEDLGHDGAAKSDGHGISRDQAADAFHGDGDFCIIHDIADAEDDERIEEDGQDDGQDEDAADFLQGYRNFFGSLRDDVEADEIERRHDGNGQGPFDHIRRRSSHEQLAFQVRYRTGQGRSCDEQDTDATDDDRQDSLQNSCRLGPDDIDGRNEDRNQNGYGQPGSVNIETGNGIQIACQEIRINISYDGRQGAGFETDDADIP